MNYKDYYKILGIDKTASTSDVKKAYRKLARQHHPDINPGNSAAEEKFKDINEAYQVLSDPDKRKKYDQFGAYWQQHEQTGGRPEDFDWSSWGRSRPTGGRPKGARPHSRTIDPEEFGQMFGGASSFSDFFEALFGRGSSGGFGENLYRSSPRGRDNEQVMQITLEEALSGTVRTLQWQDGHQIEAKIPPGVTNGSRIRLSGQGQPGPRGGQAGDLYLQIELLPHSIFQVTDHNLQVTVSVDLYTAILGGEVQVPTLEQPVKLTIPPGTSNGKTFRLRKLGLPHLQRPDQRGDLHARVNVKLPQNLSQKEIDLFRQLQALSKH
jgi:curved DNA-binding protein